MELISNLEDMSWYTELAILGIVGMTLVPFSAQTVQLATRLVRSAYVNVQILTPLILLIGATALKTTPSITTPDNV